MHWTEIVTIIFIVCLLLFLALYFGRKIKRGEKLNSCCCSSKKKKHNRLVEQYRSEYKKQK